MRIGFLEVEARRNLRVPERERYLDQPSDTRGGFAMPDIRLDRTDCTRPSRRTTVGQHPAERACLDRVAEQSAGAMRLDVLNVAWRHARVSIRFAQDRFLRERVRRHQAVAASVLIDRAAADDCVDTVAVGQRAAERFQHDQSCAFAPDVAIGTRVEGLAAPVGCHDAGLGEIHRDGRRQDQVDAAGYRERRFAVAQTGAGQMDCDQRRRAGGIDRDAWSAKVEHIREAVGGDAERIAGARVRVNAAEIGELRAPIIVVRDSHEDAGRAAGNLLGRLARIFQRFPRYLEQQTLLRIHPRRLARRDAEELRIELVYLIDKAAPSRADFAGRSRIRIVNPA